ncbi:hypothetical protein B9Z19DRAFT_1119997 [Tuber borchii]|uniref:Uncharacterized protein n=1 Tax=Tuber borchii TaxID=42251 RepID=A0A2T7A584_TUBBO|nr:hypothetical protein B9Z19DRAFT_1119997 [Tuber borchii]
MSAEIFKEIKDAILTRNHDFLLYHDVAQEDFEISWFSRDKLLKVVMPSKLHECPGAWLYEMVTAAAIDGILPRIWTKTMQISPSPVYDNFKGDYKQSVKEADLTFVPLVGPEWKNTAEYPSVVLESGWSESEAALKRDVRLWQLGSEKAVRVILLVKFFAENPMRVQLSITRSSPFAISIPEIFPAPKCAQEDPCISLGEFYAGMCPSGVDPTSRVRLNLERLLGKAEVCVEKIENCELGSRRDCSGKVPPRGSRQIEWEERRSNSISPKKSFFTYATPPEVSPTEPDATGDAGKQVGGSLPENFAASDMWRLDGQDGSRGLSCDRRSIPFLARGNASSGAGYAEQSHGPMYLQYILSSMKSGAKRIVKSMESSRVRTFLCAMPNNVYTVNSSESVARQQLPEDIMSLPLLQAIPSDPTRYSRADRSVHLFLLISRADDGATDLPPEVFMKKMQIHIAGIGPVFRLGTRWGLRCGVFC